MSATGRGVRLGGPNDFYETPGWCVDRLLEVWQPAAGLLVEPGAGNGAIIRAFAAARGPVDRWLAIECNAMDEPQIREAGPGRTIVEIGDFLRADRLPVPHVTAVIGNPPFKNAEAFVRQARRCYPQADVVFLLRINFLGSEDRAPLWGAVGMPNVLVLPNRPPFAINKKGKLGTDSTEYGWLVWPAVARTVGYVKVLGLTPKETRMAHNARKNGKR